MLVRICSSACHFAEFLASHHLVLQDNSILCQKMCQNFCLKAKTISRKTKALLNNIKFNFDFCTVWTTLVSLRFYVKSKSAAILTYWVYRGSKEIFALLDCWNLPNHQILEHLDNMTRTAVIRTSIQFLQNLFHVKSEWQKNPEISTFFVAWHSIIIGISPNFEWICRENVKFEDVKK